MAGGYFPSFAASLASAALRQRVQNLARMMPAANPTEKKIMMVMEMAG